MTTELVLLLALSAFLSAGAFFGEHGPGKVFQSSGPRLAARLEGQLATGRGFTRYGTGLPWVKPPSKAPDGSLEGL